MTIAIIAAVCVVLLVLAFLVPRLSRHPQRGVDRTLSVGQRAGGKAPGGPAASEALQLVAQGNQQERHQGP